MKECCHPEYSCCARHVPTPETCLSLNRRLSTLSAHASTYAYHHGGARRASRPVIASTCSDQRGCRQLGSTSRWRATQRAPQGMGLPTSYSIGQFLSSALAI